MCWLAKWGFFMKAINREGPASIADQRSFVSRLSTFTLASLCLLMVASAPALAQSSGLGSGALTSTLSGLTGGMGSSADLQKAQNAARNGLSDDEMNQACEGAISKHMSSADVDALGKTLGLSSAQASQLSDCVARGGPTSNPNPNVSLLPQNPQRRFPPGRPRPPVSRGAFMNSTPPTSSTPLRPRPRSNNSATICFRAEFRRLRQPVTCRWATITSSALTMS